MSSPLPIFMIIANEHGAVRVCDKIHLI